MSSARRPGCSSAPLALLLLLTALGGALHGAAKSALAQDVTEPSGRWVLRHGPDRDPLWSEGPPTLRAVHAGGNGPERAAWAVGDRCTALQLVDGSWQRDARVETLCTDRLALDLRDVFVRSADDVWVVGRFTGGATALERRRCVIDDTRPDDDVERDEGCGFVLHFDGRDWSLFTGADFGSNVPVAPLNALDMVPVPGGESWTGWAVGDQVDRVSPSALILEFVYGDGRQGADGAWLLTGTASTRNLVHDLQDVTLVSAGEAWLCAEFGIEALFRDRDGRRGTWQALGKAGVGHMYAQDLSSPLHGWEGGSDGRMREYRGGCHDEDRGTQCWFENIGFPIRELGGSGGAEVRATVRDLALVAPEAGWLVGEAYNGRSLMAFLQPDDHWYVAPVSDDPGADLFGLHLDDLASGWAVGRGGVILERIPPLPTATHTPVARPSTTPSAPPSTPTRTAIPPATPTPSPSPFPSAEPTATRVAPPPPSPTLDLTPEPTRTRAAPERTGTPVLLPMLLRGR